MIELYIYFAIVFLFMFVDALVCVIARYKFVLWKSLLTSLFFPVTAPFLVLTAPFITKNFRDEI